MFKIVNNKISKYITKNVISIEKRLNKDIKESSINKRILNKIDDEASLLGKAKLISEQILFLNKEVSKANKNVKERIRNQLIFFYIELYKLNHKLHDALRAEISADARLLKMRVEKKLKLQHVYEDLFYKLKNLAANLVKEGHMHLRRYFSVTSKKKAHYGLAMKSIRRLYIIYNLLKSEDHILHFRKILLIKTIHMFKELLKFSNKNAKLISKEITLLERNKFGKEYKRIVSIVDNQIKDLHHFAINFNNYIIHSEPFYAQGKKHIIITHDVKPVF